MTVISSESNVIDYTYVNQRPVPGEKIVPSFGSPEHCMTSMCGNFFFFDNTATKVTNINATNSTIWTIHNAHTWVHLALCQTHVWCDTHQSLFFLCKKNIYNFCRIYRCRYSVSFNSFWVNLTLNNNSRRKHTTQMYSLTLPTITRWANLSVYVSLCPSIYHQHCFVQFFTFLLLLWFTVDAMRVDR